jgi:cysteine dioxygenase
MELPSICLLNEKKKINIILNSNKDSTKLPQSLDDLITALLEGDRATYNQIIHSIKFSSNAFDKYVSWSNECYTRNCIIYTEKFELILICWCKGHSTPIHDHDGEECWVKVIKGEFKETIYKENESGALDIVKTIISKQNQVTYMKDFMGFHSLENLSDNKSMSLHLYAKPIRKCRIFDAELNTFVLKELEYDTIAS